MIVKLATTARLRQLNHDNQLGRRQDDEPFPSPELESGGWHLMIGTDLGSYGRIKTKWLLKLKDVEAPVMAHITLTDNQFHDLPSVDAVFLQEDMFKWLVDAGVQVCPSCEMVVSRLEKMLADVQAAVNDNNAMLHKGEES